MSESERLANVRATLLRELRDGPPLRPWWIDALGLAVLQLSVVVGIAVACSWLGATRITVGWPASVLVVAVLAATFAAVQPGPRRPWSVFVVVGGAALAAAVGASARPHVLTILGDVDCALAEVGASVVPAIAALVVLRRFSVSSVGAFFGGLGVGGSGLLALELTCPVATFGHVVAFHLVPCLAVAVAFTALRSRMRSHGFAP